MEALIQPLSRPLYKPLSHSLVSTMIKSGRGLDPRLNLHVWDNLKLDEGETVKIEVRVPASLSGGGPGGAAPLPLKITVAWYDPPSPVGSSRNLLLQVGVQWVVWTWVLRRTDCGGPFWCALWAYRPVVGAVIMRARTMG